MNDIKVKDKSKLLTNMKRDNGSPNKVQVFVLLLKMAFVLLLMKLGIGYSKNVMEHDYSTDVTLNQNGFNMSLHKNSISDSTPKAS